MVVGLLALWGRAVLGVRLGSSLGLNLFLNIMRAKVAASKILSVIGLGNPLAKLFMESSQTMSAGGVSPDVRYEFERTRRPCPRDSLPCCDQETLCINGEA